MTARAALRLVDGRSTDYIELPRSELVGAFMDLQALAEEAVYANAAAWQTVQRLPPGPWRDEMQAGHLAAHEALKKFLIEARLAAGRYDGVAPTNGA